MSHPHAIEAPTRPEERPTETAAPAPESIPIHDRLTWDLDDLVALTGISRRTWERWKSAGKLPRHLKIGRRVLWPAESIRRFLADLAEGRGVAR